MVALSARTLCVGYASSKVFNYNDAPMDNSFLKTIIVFLTGYLFLLSRFKLVLLIVPDVQLRKWEASREISA